jgi:exodeoxyribonuclease V beta subunit
MPFDPIKTQLNNGVMCLEASAGTGKTFSLAGIFLRLLLEEKIAPTEILVVTYTKAATAELRGKIRERLREALAVFQEAKISEDELLKSLWNGKKVNKADAIQRLKLALELIDQVSVDTIHAFCQRTLQAQAFESGILFDMELVPDQTNLFQELAADYFRKHIYQQDFSLAAVATSQGITPDVLAKMLKLFVTHHDLQINSLPAARPVDAVACEMKKQLKKLLDALGKICKSEDAKLIFVSYFTENDWVKGTVKQANPLKIRAALSILEAFYATSIPPVQMWDNAVRFFSKSAIAGVTKAKANRPSPEPELFAICEAILSLPAEYALAHRISFLQWADDELALRKQKAKRQSYDDLIVRLADALDGKSGQSLADSVRKQYKVALIDEFQDTDPQQWKIFKSIFGGSAAHRLFLIGDPKQAIYGFRGADVTTYVQATTESEAANRHDLGTNWRSEEALVTAVNTVFESGGTEVFVEDRIGFAPVGSAKKADEKPFMIGGTRPAPFQVWCWDSEGKAVGTGEAKKQLPVSVAAEISRLLRDDSCQVAGRHIQPKDFAVLVESHAQASAVKKTLQQLLIPAVEMATESVLESDEARELQWILMGILDSGRDHLVKSALTTDTMGWMAGALLKCASDQNDWQDILLHFKSYRKDWEQEGFFYMFQNLLRSEKIFEKLLRFPDGERRITNLLHLGELLEDASKAQHLNPLRLLRWFESRRLSDEAAPEEYQLRLESDEDAVRIVTIHASKGLEYPVVFCPFFQKDASLRPITNDNNKQVIKQTVLCHDPQTNQMIWDLSVEPESEHVRRAQKELLAEKMRLFYVALTRAKNRCYLVSAPYAKNKSTPLAWLLHPNKSAGLKDPVAACGEKEAQNPATWKNWWSGIANRQRAAIKVDELPVEVGGKWTQQKKEAEIFEARACERDKITQAWYLTSFSNLSKHILPGGVMMDAVDEPDHDASAPEPALPAEEGQATPPAGIFALPGGTRTGDCLHKILEKFDFAESATSKKNDTLVKGMMKAFGFAKEEQVKAVADMLDRLRQTPLDPDDKNFTLEQIPAKDRLVELEFNLKATNCDGSKLVRAIRGESNMDGQSGTSDKVHNYLKGFVDLIFKFGDKFYVLDWKSNHLGNRIEDYNVEAMQKEICECYYDLQFHLYGLALHKHLSLRLKGYDFEKHFGGVRYVFLRGLMPERPDLAIYRYRPGKDVIENLDKLLSPLA